MRNLETAPLHAALGTRGQAPDFRKAIRCVPSSATASLLIQHPGPFRNTSCNPVVKAEEEKEIPSVVSGPPKPRNLQRVHRRET